MHSRRPRPVSVCRTAALLVVALALAGCTVGPDYQEPTPDVPDVWHEELTRGLSAGEAEIHTWWKVLGDPLLEKLIERAARGNLDLQEAYARIAESRAILGLATGQYYPDGDGIGSYQRSRLSEETVPVLPGSSRTDDFWQAGFDASWEIDVFGRIRRSVESADAGLQASVELYRDVLVALYAEVARNYVDVRTFQERIRLAEENVRTQSGTLQLTRDRFEAQLVSELDVRQAELNLASTESFIPTLRILLTQSLNRLGVLLGEHPSALHQELTAAEPIPATPESVVVGVPVDLLRQRPDIRASERQLAAQTAQIGVATANLYPRFSLVGTFAWEAHDFGKVWDAGSLAYSYGPAMRWNIFDGGRVRSNIRVEDARTEQSRLRYENVVLSALEEVQNSMVGYTEEQNRAAALDRSVTAAQSSVDLVQTLYRTGLTDFQNVLDTERSLFVQQDELASSRGGVIQNLIRLYKALGGGWEPESLASNDQTSNNHN